MYCEVYCKSIAKSCVSLLHIRKHYEKQRGHQINFMTLFNNKCQQYFGPFKQPFNVHIRQQKGTLFERPAGFCCRSERWRAPRVWLCNNAQDQELRRTGSWGQGYCIIHLKGERSVWLYIWGVGVYILHISIWGSQLQFEDCVEGHSPLIGL